MGAELTKRIRTLRTLTPLAFLALALASCAPTPPINAYKPPDLAPDAAATITGSELQDADFFSSNTHAGVSKIDGQLLQGGSGVVAPGLHKLTLSADQKQFGAYSNGTVELQLDAKPGMHYVVRMTEPVHAGGNCHTANIWVEDQTGAVVTDKMVVGIIVYTGEYGQPAGGILLNALIKTPCNS